MTENKKKNNDSRHERLEMLRGLQKKLIMRAVLAVTTLLLTSVLLFALTAAWYTNIVGTDGLSFTAKKWNFTGEIKIESESLSIAPGDSGIVPMTISNESTELAVASVTASKAEFAEDEMKKRIYFYVDAPYYRNEERMDRVYVSSNSSYTYTLFPQSSLVINENVQNSYPLKWEWVYDVLGYYVTGTGNEDGSFNVEEYLRPIEYDYDIFSTTFDAEGNLKTIDGEKTAEEFLLEVSETDGYAGTIDTAKKDNGYYPVSVNSEGYGVWAYLCTLSDIDKNTKYDTYIGNNAENMPQCPVTVTVTGSNSNGGAIEVSNADTLESILTTSTHASVKLTDNIEFTKEIQLAEGSQVSIDLNGQKLSSTATHIFDIPVGSKITIDGGDDLQNPGRIVGKGGSGTYAFWATGAQVEINNVNITNVDAGLRIEDNQNSSNTDSVIRIADSTIEGERFGVWIFGNNGNSDTATTVIVERCKLYGKGYAGLFCNGSYKDIDITVSDTYIEGYYAGIYQPARESILTVKNSTVIGTNDAGIVVKGGTVNIEDCTITAKGPYVVPSININGFSDSGAGIYIEASYKRPITVNISGNTSVTSVNSEAVRLTKSDTYTDVANFNITGGSFTSAKTATVDNVTTRLDNGIDKYLPSSGYRTTHTETDATETYTVVEKND